MMHKLSLITIKPTYRICRKRLLGQINFLEATGVAP